MHGKIHPKKKAPFSSSYEKRSVKTLTFFISIINIRAHKHTIHIYSSFGQITDSLKKSLREEDICVHK